MASNPPCTFVRAATSADLDALVALELQAFSGDRMSRAQYRRHLASLGAAVLIAEAPDDGLLGSALVFFRRGSSLARLYSIATAPAGRGRGIGASLLAAAEAAARARGCRALRLEVRVDNVAAMGLYERAGYRRIGGYPGYYEDGADAWRYEKGLAAS
ncbi:GNAT family N-acetyltransferase [Frateuria hangzhouensis]|uniref:GNAT family N-acetyltransferase n=1 Tax=Frateuria hangzhouensis TaxID=2995589 RepID=UPI00226089C7|nr:GNAT family N-acetyltransferase [Frateuria sp. STR12]MCX7513333.1 GNAT family N-acetyltransferase [Frateuria sp. STR12]